MEHRALSLDHPTVEHTSPLGGERIKVRGETSDIQHRTSNVQRPIHIQRATGRILILPPDRGAVSCSTPKCGESKSSRPPSDVRSRYASQRRGAERGSVSRSTPQLSRRPRPIRTLSRQRSRCGSQTRAPILALSRLVHIPSDRTSKHVPRTFLISVKS